MEKLREAEENLHQLEMIMTTNVKNKESKEKNTDKIEKNHADEVQQLKLQLEVKYNYTTMFHHSTFHTFKYFMYLFHNWVTDLCSLWKYPSFSLYSWKP